MSLKPRRYTFYVVPGETVGKVIKDNWSDPARSSRALPKKWTGRTVFQKVTPDTSSSVAPPLVADGQPVRPLVAGMSTLRGELAVGQRSDPELRDIIAYLEKNPLGSLVHAKHLKSELVKRAQHFSLAPDGVLLAKGNGDDDEELPVMPNAPYKGESAALERTKNMTWKHLVLSCVHNTPTGPHIRVTEMVTEIRDVFFWIPPEKLRKDCEVWTSRCKICVALYHKPLGAPPSRAVVEFRPYFRVQIDLMEVRPKGENGESHLLTFVCVATRYLFLRTIMGREHHEIAEKLFDIILDCGVVPCIIQSDLEFLSNILEELTVLLGSNQIFSTALRPQSQGIVERSHRDIRALLASFIETFVRSHPRRWPSFVRVCGSKASS